MNVTTKRRSLWLATLILIASVFPRIADATIVEFQTVRGNFEVNLYDNATPQTVANFLDYVNNGAYTSSVFHRSVTGFIVQGGGFSFNIGWPLNAIPANPAVVNEPEFSNVRGTISMAKLSGQPNSATNQWFFNLADNSANLDGQNSGFTVFGEVMGNGMAILDDIAGLETFDFGGALAALPLDESYTLNEFSTGLEPDATHLIIVSAIIVSDTTVDSAAGLNPPANTSVSPTPAPAPAGDSGGGGSISFLLLCGLLLGYRARRS